ncbi:transposase [Streptomyces thinghirensis]|uniref:Transposase DDE domain-containing protein n=1 Tax=Streptomyces thinghirensis TaxID=551547 RepID=A0ABP9T275_9ACTN
MRTTAAAADPAGYTQMFIDAWLPSSTDEADSAQARNPLRVRSGVEGTVNEFAHGHGVRCCRCRGQRKARIQHVLTAIAVNIERLSGLSPTEEASTARRPTAFQDYHAQREIPRLKSWRTLGT